MQSLQHLVVDLGRRGDRRVLVTAVLAVKAAWLVILAVVGAAFLRVAGVPLLDLQVTMLGTVVVLAYVTVLALRGGPAEVTSRGPARAALRTRGRP